MSNEVRGGLKPIPRPLNGYIEMVNRSQQKQSVEVCLSLLMNHHYARIKSAFIKM